MLISEVKYLLENRDKDAPDTAYAPLFHLHLSAWLLMSMLLLLPASTKRPLNTLNSSQSSQPQIQPGPSESELNKPLGSLSNIEERMLKTILFVLRTLRREPALTQFETAQIANLCPADAEEAKSIIPRYTSPLPII